MSIKSEIAALKVAAESQVHEDKTIVTSWPELVGRLLDAGETDLAAKIVATLRRRGERVAAPATLEPAIRRQKAVTAAETFQKINSKNFTDDPLPQWVQNEIGVTF